MKTIKFAKRWRHQMSETEYAEYPAGAELEVSDAVAKAAEKAGVLASPPAAGKPAATQG